MNQLSNGNSTHLTQNKQTKIAALYARVSTNRQEEQETIDSQIDEIKNRIIEDGHVIPPEYIFQDDGWTGEMLQRPGLDAMRDAAMANKFQLLYVYDRGRLSRVFAYQEIIIEELIDRGIEFITLHDIKAETPEERVLQAMQGVFHEYERVKIAERMRRGKLFKAKNGVLINGHALYGYNYIKKVETIQNGVKHSEPAHYEINEDEARVVKLIYQWFGVERVSLKEVIRRLYDMKIPPKKRKSDFWTKGPITRILRCETYTNGLAYYNKHEAVVAKKPIKNDKYKKIKRSSRRLRPKEEWIPFEVPVLIDDKNLYAKVQKMLDYNQKYACKKRKYDYLLSGLIDCECGCPRVGDGVDKTNFYYRCSQRIYKFPLVSKCTIKGMNAVVLDQSLWNHLIEFLKNPIQLKQFAAEWLREQTNSDADKREKERLEGVIAKLTEEEKRYAKAYGTGTLDFEQFKDLMRETKKKKSGFEEQLTSLNKKIAQQGIDTIQLEEIVKEAKRVISSLDLTNKFQTVRDIIDKVIVKGGRVITVRGHIPLFAVNMGYEPISRNSRLTQCWEVDIV